MIRRFFHAAALLALLTVLVYGATIRQASAHPYNNGYSELRLEKKEVYYSLFLPAAGLPFIDSDKDGKISDAELSSGRAPLDRLLSDGIVLDNGGIPMDSQVLEVRADIRDDVPGVSAELLFHGDQALESLLIHYNLLFDDIDPDHLNFVTIYDGDDLDQYLFEAGDREYYFDNPPGLGTMLAVYFKLGVLHLASGADHLAFLFALLLAASRWKEALAVVTAFTASHSITLLLAAAGYMPVSPRVVEAAISLSICFVAAGNPFIRRPGRRWIPALLLGLIHGLGFAGALGETGLPASHVLPSLLSFNLGVEAGQVVLVAVVLPLLLLLRRYERYYRYTVWIGSAGLFMLGLNWFLQRVAL